MPVSISGESLNNDNVSGNYPLPGNDFAESGPFKQRTIIFGMARAPNVHTACFNRFSGVSGALMSAHGSCTSIEMTYRYRFIPLHDDALFLVKSGKRVLTGMLREHFFWHGSGESESGVEPSKKGCTLCIPF